MLLGGKMFGWILLAIGFVGFGVAGWLDLKTTEFPDWLPYSMIVLGLAVHGAWAWFAQDISIIINSAVVGTLFLAFGLGLYFTKQWGDGDAWLLGAMGYMFPTSVGFAGTTFFPFPMVILFNLLFVSFIYLVGYSVILGMVNPKISKRYCRVIEKNLFKRKVPASKLRVGDVLIREKWKGLTEEELNKIKKKGGEYWIKEGVRFAPVFVITMLVSLFLGNLAMIFV